MLAPNHTESHRRSAGGSVEAALAPDESVRLRTFLLIMGTLAALAIVLNLPPIPQDPSYHHFADRRTLLGIPNALDVLSNVLFLVVGALGLHFLWRERQGDATKHFLEPEERRPYLALFGGVLLIGCGSTYYHVAPGDARLVWDRLPMTIVFMAFLAATIGERINLKTGLWMLVPLMAAGIGSVLYWRVSQLSGAGDLRFYIFVQYFPMLLIPLIVWFFPARYTRSQGLLSTVGWYILAKLFELLDARIFALGGLVSGHTLKHLAAGMGTFAVLRALKRRQSLR